MDVRCQQKKCISCLVLKKCKRHIEGNVTRAVPTNLILLQHYFENEKDMYSILGDTTFDTPVATTFPDFKIYNHSFSQFLATYQVQNLRKMVSVAKSDAIIFQKLAEPLLDGSISIFQDTWSVDKILSITELSLGSILFIYCCWSHYKMKQIAVALVNPQPTLSSFQVVEQNFEWDHVIFMLLCTILTCFSIVVYKMYKRKSETKLVLEFTSASDCVDINIAILPLCPIYWDIKTPVEEIDVKITGCLYPLLEIQCESIQIRNTI